MLRRCLILASLVAAPVAAHAQFATFIPPKPKAPDSVAAATAAAEKARAERATAARISNMKAWVDSAAGLPPRPSPASANVLMPVDTTPVLVATAHGRPAQPIVSSAPAVPAAPAPRTESHEARAGAKAPATASDLPLLLLIGSLSLVVGLVLLADPPGNRRRA